QGLAVPQDLLQRLRDGGQVDSRPLGGGVVEHVLLGQDGLAAAGRPNHQVDAMGGEATAQDGAQPPVAAGPPSVAAGLLGHRGLAELGRRKALAPSRSLTAETSWSGSSGFSRNPLAPASTASWVAPR